MPQSVGEAVPRMYTICLIIWFFLGLTAVFGVSRNPEFVRQEELRKRYETVDQINMQRDNEIEANHEHINYIEFGEALKSRRFWLIGFMMFCGIFYGLYLA